MRLCHVCEMKWWFYCILGIINPETNLKCNCKGEVGIFAFLLSIPLQFGNKTWFFHNITTTSFLVYMIFKASENRDLPSHVLRMASQKIAFFDSNIATIWKISVKQKLTEQSISKRKQESPILILCSGSIPRLSLNLSFCFFKLNFVQPELNQKSPR